jgi:hypothetical protein
VLRWSWLARGARSGLAGELMKLEGVLVRYVRRLRAPLLPCGEGAPAKLPAVRNGVTLSLSKGGATHGAFEELWPASPPSPKALRTSFDKLRVTLL